MLAPTCVPSPMTVTAAEQAMPVVMGWHPCFRRRLDTGEAAQLFVPGDLDVGAPTPSGIPTGQQVPVPGRPLGRRLRRAPG